MFITTSKKDLVEAVNSAVMAIDYKSRNVLPLLQTVKIVANGHISCSATDLDIVARKVVDGDGEQETIATGVVIVDAKRLQAILKGFNDKEQVTIMRDGEELSFSIGQGETILDEKCFPVTEYPAYHNIDTMKEYILDAEKLAYLVKNTSFAITKEETQRWSLNGAQLIIKNGSGHMVATDGHRMSSVRIDSICLDKDLNVKLLIPAKALNMLAKEIDLASKYAKKIKHPIASLKMRIAAKVDFIEFTINAFKVVSRMMVGQFPDYTKVMPKEVDLACEIDTKKLKEAITSAVSLKADSKLPALKFSFDAKTQCLTIKDRVIEENLETNKVLAKVFGSLEWKIAEHSDTFDLCLNGKYLLDCLNTTSAQTCIIELSMGKVPNKEGEVYPNQAEIRCNFGSFRQRYIVMPTR